MVLTKLLEFQSMKWAQFLFAVFCVVILLALKSGDIVDPNENNTSNGIIEIAGAHRPIVAVGTYELTCLHMARISAFSMYPVIILVFLTKCRALMSYLRSSTPLSMYLVANNHKFHIYAGKYIVFATIIHTIFHLMRWGNQGCIALLWKSIAGITGVVVTLATVFITIPMWFLKDKIAYEIRKAMHYCFYIFAIVLCFHVPTSAFPIGGYIATIVGICVGLYTLDALYVFYFMTEIVGRTNFHVLPDDGVQMSMSLSKRFHNLSKNGGVVYVCLPWVNRHEWHAFSLYPNPVVDGQYEVFMQKSGDWTKAVLKQLERRTTRPALIQGPFESPYNQALYFDNQIFVASGIGITAALSVIHEQKEFRRCNLIWSVRDPSMLEFFLERFVLDDDGWNLIFYTGKQPLDPLIEELNTRVQIIKGRPDLRTVILNIMYGIESELGRPENWFPKPSMIIFEGLLNMINRLDADKDLTYEQKISELFFFVTRNGCSFGKIMHELEENSFGFEEAKDETEEVLDAEARFYKMKQLLEDEIKIGETILIRETTACSELEDFTSADMSTRSITSRRAKANIFDRQLFSVPSSKALHSTEFSLARNYVANFQPWKNYRPANDFVKGLDKDAVLSTWGILYCGGSSTVEKGLESISKEFGVQLNFETSGW